ncbi:MAG: isoleucine--tRNA ligase [Clostridia bacterium]|nr:isoleucine--tRNA ligase [Clostridia bacterium]
MKDYKDTLNLPATGFPMRGNLPAREPEIRKRWDEIDLYRKILESNEGRPSFILHDGPPFSNGNIHMGTAMNKVLKDIINKSKSMAGFRTPFVPGWDNHGMPIESAIIKQSKLDRKKMTIPEFRSACRDFASRFVALQMESFERLGVVADWKRPYLTMNPSFESREVRVFGKMYENGYIYKGLKPVYWCAHDETALAEAEIEYQDMPCTSIYVKFRVRDDLGKLSPDFDLSRTFFVIWTTTPWTLPGNVAIAAHPRENYCVVRAGEDHLILAVALAEETMRAAGIEDYEIEKTGLKGADLEYMQADHPFLPRTSQLCCADYVTMDTGTGFVHTAPGYGAEDYVTGMKYHLDIPVPVDDRGYQGEGAGKFAGLRYDQSNEAIVNDMRETGALLASKEIIHPYPHCWRCKKPVIYRATPQWFCSVETFREQAVAACENVEWMPSWGKERMESMIRERADWCISRQRHWGLPIPVFYCGSCGKPVCTPETIDRIAKLFGEHGSNVWFEREAEELLPEGFVCPHCGKNEGFSKETDTLDGWFDSGSTHFDVLDGRADEGMSRPCDLYLEGGDQYRGWFQSSLLTSIATTGKAPYKAVLTHGWTVDGEGKAMHKSLGNYILPDDLIPKYGADLVRLWAASSDYHLDMRCADSIFKQLSDKYLKIRNTARFMLGNLNEFRPEELVPFSEMEELDQWAVSELQNLIAKCRAAYDSYEFYAVTYAIHNFCVVEMSNFYLDIIKDRLYCEDGQKRLSAQSALFLILDGMVRLLAPILAFTANEIWLEMPHRSSDDARHVMLNDIPEADETLKLSDEAEEKFAGLMALREDVNKALELARAEKTVGKSLDAKIILGLTGDAAALYRKVEGPDLADELIVSELEAQEGTEEGYEGTAVSGLTVKVVPSEQAKCPRCWKRAHVGLDPENPELCDRCAKVLMARA